MCRRSIFASTECTRLGGQRTRQVLVQSIVEMIERFYPRSTHLRPGQTPWVTVNKDEKGFYGKHMSQTRLSSVVLDLIPATEAIRRYIVAFKQVLLCHRTGLSTEEINTID